MQTDKISSSAYRPGLWVLPFIILFCVYGVIGRYAEASYTPNDLITENGKTSLVSIEHSTSKKNAQSNYVQFVLNQKTFVVPAATNLTLEEVAQKITYATTITIWHRTRLQQLLGMGQLLDVYQLKTDAVLLIPINQTRSTSLGMVKFIGGLGTLLLLLWFYALVKYMKLKRVETSS